MIVTYVKPSRDAAIAGTYKDIKIKNNYSTDSNNKFICHKYLFLIVIHVIIKKW